MQLAGYPGEVLAAGSGGKDLDWNIHCCPCGSVLSDFQGKTKIAAITAIVTADVKR